MIFKQFSWVRGRLQYTGSRKHNNMVNFCPRKWLRSQFVQWSLYERVFEIVFDRKTKLLFIKWSGGGRLQEVVARRELTVVTKL